MNGEDFRKDKEGFVLAKLQDEYFSNASKDVKRTLSSTSLPFHYAAVKFCSKRT